MIKRYFLPTILVALLFSAPSAYALKVIETDGYFIYFPAGSGQLAQRIASWCSPMAAFLETQNILLKKPLHIHLDQELDQPAAITQLYPHREIRIPMRAPGVLEDGYTESDPWRYFLFKGLCELGIHNERTGLPRKTHYFLGEIISPNLILPEWTVDGISHLLYERYSLRTVDDPIAKAIFLACPIPNLDRVSHHPEIWPGRFSFRIYGRPFVRWLYQRFGWERILLFLKLHGKGIVPFEIDFKAKQAFGRSWNQLWQEFKRGHALVSAKSGGKYILGYWDAPYHYWNEAGIYPGVLSIANRGRYGYLDRNQWLWLNEYTQGISRIKIYRGDTIRQVLRAHVWDPGPGSVAVTRRRDIPYLLVFGPRNPADIFDSPNESVPVQHEIAGPPGAIQMSGPVMDDRGRIAVAANTNGNWDIWIFDDMWYRLTDQPSIEMDPWWMGEKLIFSSNAGGTFQIHGSDMQPLTHSATAAILPRGSAFLELTESGWQRSTISRLQVPPLPETYARLPDSVSVHAEPEIEAEDYSPWKSIWPNFLAPDFFYNLNEFQLGLVTEGKDVSRIHSWNAGVRYDLDKSQFMWRVGYEAREFGTRVTRYPLTYIPRRDTAVDEVRLEFNLSWTPEKLEELTLGANWRRFEEQSAPKVSDEEWWGNVRWNDTVAKVHTLLNWDLFYDGSQSLYGELLYWFGEKVNTVMRFQGGKTWGDLKPGHNTFRIGGNAEEGVFTQRSSRLFAVRGFDSNILEAGQAATASLDILWPFAELQAGYKTLPLFLHNVKLSTFVDAGFASEHYDADEILIGAGVELITGFQLAWDKKSHLSIGLGWPLKKPEDIQQDGPVWLILIGRPL